MKQTKIHFGAFAILALQQASAALLIQENFAYTAGGINGIAANGTGLSGNWATSVSAGSATYDVQASSLAFAGHFTSSGGSLVMSSGNAGEKRAAATVSATLPANSTFYASSLMTLNPAGTYYDDWAVEQRFNTASNGAEATSSGRNSLSTSGSGTTANRRAGVSVDGTVVSTATNVVAAGTTYLFVTAYISDATNVTSASMYGFTVADYATYLTNSTAANAAANLAIYRTFTVTETATRPLADFDFLQFTINGGPTPEFDDFRLGTQITDVVNVIPEPGVALLGSLGLLALLRHRRPA